MAKALRAFAFLAMAVAACAQLQMSVAQLRAFIRSSIQMKHDDVKVAQYVKKIKLSDKLDDRTVEELQGMGAGPRTVAALRALSEISATLPAPPPPPPPKPVVTIPPPDSIEQKRILAEITQNALNYSKNLPNFICTQVTRRNTDPSGMENWRLMDTIQEQLSYFEQKENYKVTMVNSRMVTNIKHEQLGGATSSGEFGSMLYEIFSPESDTEFNWERWATLRGRRMYVFNFRVPQSHSKYSIYHGESKRQIVAGYHGLIYADRDTGMVMRIKFDCDEIPVDFPIQSVSLDLNYDFIKIAEQEFVLPLKAELRSREGKYLVKNDVEFHLYRKFGTETSVTFDPIEALPDEATKEEPAKPDTPPAKPPVKK
jgi:hypothetical protein